MTRQYHLESALLPQGWGRDVLVTVADDGHISGIDVPAGQAAAHPDAQRVAGFVVPGMPNAHSHAFQRGMAGNTEYRLSARDSFWTWRRAMYALANRITPGDLQVLATQLFVEMLKVGYTSVAEFYYLHRQPGGELYAGANGLWEAVGAAAEATGIGLTFLPTLYQTSDFGAQPLKPEQLRFAAQTEWFLRAIEERCGAERRAVSATRRTGASFHSLRAVPLESLREAIHGLRRIDPGMPVHIHIAEQTKEVEACKHYTGRRPIELLLDTGLVDRHWCLVHATHATAAELAGIAATTAAVCVSVSTEANLGDGFFDALRFLKLGGRVCIGSDSQATVCPAEELRWMEYQQRLRKRRRGVLAEKSEPHVGTRLWREAAEHGASALGQPAGTLAVGRRADWLVLDATHPSMAGATAATALDHLLFAGGSAAIRDVMVAGRWVVEGRRHRAEEPLRGRFLELMAELAGRSQG
ncbi:MAG TPA: formimidoylglutamate deiminase [Steroidobacteraceae bacterium]|nr:formimidoylglutamate deiminase [Steroidobacteraceae bacterium]